MFRRLGTPQRRVLVVICLLAALAAHMLAGTSWAAVDSVTVSCGCRRVSPPQGAVVRAVLFWSPSCPHCHEVIEKVLPPLQAKYGSHLEIKLLNVVEGENLDLLFRVAEAAGMRRETAGVPFMVIGDKILIGSVQIPAELPRLIDQYLAAGGIGWPTLGGLAGVLDSEEAVAMCTLATPCADPPATANTAVAPASGLRSGFAVAIAVMIGMAAVLAYALGIIGRELRRGALPRVAVPSRLVPVLAVVGLVVAAYLAYVEIRSVPAVCGPVGDCNAVQASQYARLFGVIPIGALGVFGYLAILGAWLWGRWRDLPLADWMGTAILVMTLVGTGFSLYLTFLEPFVIKAVCAWCLTSAVVMTLLLVVSVRPVIRGEKTTRR